jgi:hypothetical protein
MPTARNSPHPRIRLSCVTQLDSITPSSLNQPFSRAIGIDPGKLWTRAIQSRMAG